MMDKTSRYYGIESSKVVLSDSDGRPREVWYLRRRLIRPAADQVVIDEHVVEEGDRLDNVASRYLYDPTQYWRLCDANEVFSPDELEVPGRKINITMPDFKG